MLHPFERFKVTYIPQLEGLKKCYLVSQTYHRYNDPFMGESKTSLLLTDYGDRSMAVKHLEALPNDKYAAIVDLQHPPHKAKLLELLGENSRFNVFWAIVKSAKELEAKLNATYKANMKHYIETHTNWRISRDTILRPSVEVVFGELFIHLKYGSQTIRIKFEEIETA